MSEANFIALNESLVKLASNELSSFAAQNLAKAVDEDTDALATVALAAASDGRKLDTINLDINDDGGATLTMGYIKAE